MKARKLIPLTSGLALALVTVIAIAAGASPSFSSVKDGLKERGFSGFSYRAITPEDVDTLKLADDKGVVVLNVFDNTPASRAGLKPGDILKKYDDYELTDTSVLVDVLNKYFAGDVIQVAYLRNGAPGQTKLVLEEYPGEKYPDLDVEYTSFVSRDVRLRAVILSPSGSSKRKLPALFMVSALGSPRLRQTPAYSMMRELACETARSGFRVMRFELRGSGDSEGDDYRTTDFRNEIDDNKAALEYLQKRDDVIPGKVFVFGHSTGGMIAGILAGGNDEISGVVISCSIGRSYFERIADTVRLQDEFDGVRASKIEKNVKEYICFAALLSKGLDLSNIVQRFPEFSRFVNKSGRIMDDRTGEYWKQQLNLNLAEIYGAVRKPVLIVYGTSDFLTQLECHKKIREIISAEGNQDVTLAVIPDTDHQYSFAKTQKESFDHYKTRNFIENPEAKKNIAEWLRKHI